VLFLLPLHRLLDLRGLVDYMHPPLVTCRGKPSALSAVASTLLAGGGPVAGEGLGGAGSIGSGGGGRGGEGGRGRQPRGGKGQEVRRVGDVTSFLVNNDNGCCEIELVGGPCPAAVIAAVGLRVEGPLSRV